MEKQKKHKLGIALSGGGVRGFAHIGALQAMNERGLHPDILSGTSAGSIAAAFYADGYTPQEMLEIFKDISFKEVAGFTIPKEGLFKTTGINDFFKKHLKAKTFEELKYPLYVIASDIEQGKKQVFSKGDLIPAVIASCSVPIVFTPMQIEGRYYVDGGLFMNFPVSVIRQQCDVLLGVNISPVNTMPYDKSLKYIIERTMNYMVGANTTEEQKLCDYIIASSDIANYATFDFKHIDNIYKKGYLVASEYLDKNINKINRDLSSHPIYTMHRKIKQLRKR